MTLPGAHQIAGASGDRLVLIGVRDVDADRSTPKDLQLTVIDSAGERTSHPYRIDGPLANSDVIGDRLISVNWKGEASAHSPATGKTCGPVGWASRCPTGTRSTASPLPWCRRSGGVVYFLNPAGDLSGLDLRTGERVWRGHVGIGATGPGPDYGYPPQLLLYQDALVAQNGSRIVSLLPRIGD